MLNYELSPCRRHNKEPLKNSHSTPYRTICASQIDLTELHKPQNKWKIRLQLTKPVTWPPLVWGVVCRAAASENFHWTFEDVAKSIVCMCMSGPFLTGYTQTLNDWYDREIDAINEPYLMQFSTLHYLSLCSY
ncbi:hypothetical protein PRUPE_4G268700 [Prunus persica]|uniref:Chlorophyll synthase n=1 Tax=Prunus persica TaxID=3760 RepID=A0A251PRR2_PRUPE|nr:hypothetical protein PRUPE_4G268700 [Prunus persica]